MEVRTGNQATVTEQIPEEWRVATIQQLIDEGFILGHLDGNHGELYPRSHEFKSHGVPYVGANDFADGDVDLDSCKFLAPARARQFRKGVARDGDVLFAHNATVGPVALLRTSEPFVILSTSATYFRCDLNTLNNSYLKAVLESQQFVRQYQAVMAQSTRFQVPITTQRRLSLVIAPISQQRTIAAALSDVDELLVGLDRLIAKMRDLKLTVMQQLLRGQTRLPGFEGEWQLRRLGEIAHFAPGSYLAQDQYRDGEYDVQGAGSVMGRHVVANFDQRISVIGRVGTVGRPRFMPRGCWVNNNAAAIVAARHLGTPEFLHLLLLTVDWSKATSITAQPFLVVPALMDMVFNVPPLREQFAIAALLSDMDAELAALEARRDKTRALKH